MKRTSIYTLVLGTLVTTGLFGVFSVAIVHAQQPAYTPLAPLPCTTLKDSNGVPNCTQDAKTTTLTNYLPGVFTLAIGLAAAMAFVMISWGGFTLITTDSVYGKQEGREKVWNAVKGLVLVLGAWAILFTINPQLVNFNLNVSTPDYSQIPKVTVTDVNGNTVTVPGASNNLNGYNIAAYDPTEPGQAALVQSVYNNSLLQQVPNTASGMDSYIQRYFPGSPITGDMVMAASGSPNNVDPKLVMAFMQAESGFGTKGLGATTNNPGNVGNITNVQSNPYSSWQDGVNAVAGWVNTHRAN